MLPLLNCGCLLAGGREWRDLAIAIEIAGTLDQVWDSYSSFDQTNFRSTPKSDLRTRFAFTQSSLLPRSSYHTFSPLERLIRLLESVKTLRSSRGGFSPSLSYNLTAASYLEQGRKELYWLDSTEPAWTNTGYIGIFLLSSQVEEKDNALLANRIYPFGSRLSAR